MVIYIYCVCVWMDEGPLYVTGHTYLYNILLFSAPTTKENVFAFWQVKICTSQTALKMMQIAFLTHLLCFSVRVDFLNWFSQLAVASHRVFCWLKTTVHLWWACFKVELLWQCLLRWMCASVQSGCDESKNLEPCSARRVFLLWVRKTLYWQISLCILAWKRIFPTKRKK